MPGDTITWTNDVEKAFAKGAKARKPIMICINSQRVDGGREEPAAKGLREVVYKDLRVVGKSRKFICVFLTSAGSSGDYGELRARFGIDGLIVSPQHIFAHPDHKSGQTPLARKQYWPYGKGADAVKALLGMMDQALADFAKVEGSPATPDAPDAPDTPAEPDAPDAPDGDDARTKWIAKLIGITENGASCSARKPSARSSTTTRKATASHRCSPR